MCETGDWSVLVQAQPLPHAAMAVNDARDPPTGDRGANEDHQGDKEGWPKGKMKYARHRFGDQEEDDAREAEGKAPKRGFLQQRGFHLRDCSKDGLSQARPNKH